MGVVVLFLSTGHQSHPVHFMYPPVPAFVIGPLTFADELISGYVVNNTTVYI